MFTTWVCINTASVKFMQFLSKYLDVTQFNIENFYPDLNSRRLYSIARLLSNMRPHFDLFWSVAVPRTVCFP